jgi:hypothetical protein
VISASEGPSGITYVLAPWRDEHTIRTFEHYDEAAEARRVADYNATKAQQKASVAASLSGILLGNLPPVVQTQIANNFGVSPARMTRWSTLLPLILLATCVWIAAGGAMGETGTRVPIWLWLIIAGLMLEAAVRFHISMSQDRGVGTLWGMIVYIFVWLVAPKRWGWVSPFAEEKGTSTSFTLPPSDDIALRDAIEMRSTVFTLLSAAEQQRLAQRFGYDYRKNARTLSIIILIGASMGVVSMGMKISDGDNSVATLLSFLMALFLTVEQIFRLLAFARGPAGSVLGVIVRPFVRSYLV